MTGCFLAQHGVMELGDPMPPCDGQLVRVHLIPQQQLKRTDAYRRQELALYDRRLWVWACGGIMGNGGHHGMLDVSKRLRIPRSALPVELEDLAVELGLDWWLDRQYGCRDCQVSNLTSETR